MQSPLKRNTPSKGMIVNAMYMVYNSKNLESI